MELVVVCILLAIKLVLAYFCCDGDFIVVFV